MKAKYLIVAFIALALGFGVSAVAGFLLSKYVYQRADLPEVNEYAGIIEINVPVSEVRAKSTAGEVVVPIKGKVNIVLPQYVHCPDICHWETSILAYALERLIEEGLQDDIVVVTLGVNPYYETLEDAQRYLQARAGKLMERGVTWIWVQDDLEVMKKLWEQYRFAVLPYCVKADGSVVELPVDLTREEVERYRRECEFLGVTHTGGFAIIDRNGIYRYFITPTDKGWVEGQRGVAETIYIKVKALIEEAGAGS